MSGFLAQHVITRGLEAAADTPCCAAAAAAAAAIGLLLLLWALRRAVIWRKRSSDGSSTRCKAAVALGMGGHTREMVEIIKGMDRKRFRFSFICDADDKITADAFRGWYRQLTAADAGEDGDDTEEHDEPVMHKVPVPRSTSKSLIRAAVTTIRSFARCAILLSRMKPDLLITNGPGIAVPLCYAALMVNVVLGTNIKIVYIESCCRVDNLSYSGRLVYYIADMFIVLWPQLAAKYPGARYFGRIDKL